jgi:hypothetical protein
MDSYDVDSALACFSITLGSAIAPNTSVRCTAQSWTLEYMDVPHIEIDTLEYQQILKGIYLNGLSTALPLEPGKDFQLFCHWSAAMQYNLAV